MGFATNVVRRGGSYYFRVRVPERLSSVTKRRELWRSMKTNEVSCARIRAAYLASLTVELWLALEQAMTMREGETMIALKDFRTENGIAYYLVRDATEGQSIKSDASWRRIPLHSVLLDLGFLSFVEWRKQQGGVRLFDELREDASGYFSGIPSKFLNRLVALIKDPDPDLPGQLTFHSTRHTVIGRLRAAEVRMDVSTELTGHENGDVHAGYGGVDLAALKSAVDKIDYPGINIDGLRLPPRFVEGSKS